MSAYDDYDPRDRRRRPERPPYPPADDDYGRDERRSRRPDPTPAPPPVSGSQVGKGTDIPPPPLGSAMKREGSRSRVPNLKPEFPDEASYLNGRSPDLERKNGDRDRKFRERREGYMSDEGEALRGDPRRTRSRREPSDRPRYDDADKRPAASEVSGIPIRERRDRAAKSEGEDEYDRRRPPRDYDDRRRRDDERPRRRDPDPYYDDEPRRRPRRGVEYGAEPIKPSRRDEDAYRSDRDKRPRRQDDYDDDYDRPTRRKSLPVRRGDKDDDDYYDRGGRDSRRRRDDYDDRDYRRPARRRSYDDDDDYYRRRDDRDRRDRRDGRDRDDRDRKGPTQMKIGNMDLGPAIDKGQKYYQTMAPILAPIVMGYLKKH